MTNNMYYLNLTQHTPTQEQYVQGMYEPTDKERVKLNLNVVGVEDDNLYVKQIVSQVEELLSIVRIEIQKIPGHYEERRRLFRVVLGGHPSIVMRLAIALEKERFTAVTSYSERISTEEILPNGEVIKKSTFKHKGFKPI